MWTGSESRRKHRAGMVLALCLAWGVNAPAQFVVAPGGNDSWPGTVDSPFVTIPRAVTAVSAGGHIYVRGGTHPYAAGISLNKNGASGSPIRLWAYPGESPVLDFSAQPRGTSSRGITMGNAWWHVKGLTVRSAGDNGIYITGSNNTVEACILADNEDTGLQISGGGSNNLILNCDSYANYDSATNGENADGFAPKLNIGPGNVFRGCRAWDNADDGWDIFEGQNTVVIDSCWAFRNGYNIWGDPNFQGDGNGFKLGGNFVAASHVVTRSVAFDNRSKGFDQNNNTAGQIIHNCTGYRNLSRNYSFPAAPAAGAHALRNNVSFNAANTIIAGTIETANSWQGFTVTTADFQSLDTSLAAAPRSAGGALPANALLRLAAGSDLINGGVDVGLSYNGPAPDLGAFETGVLPSPPPVAVSPAAGAQDLPLTVPLRWRMEPLAEWYRVELAADSAFAVVVVTDSLVTDTVRTITGLAPGALYWWRVAGVNDAGTGPWSAARAFSTATASTAVFTYPDDWALVSLPFGMADRRVTAVFPEAVGRAYTFDPVAGYVERDTLDSGTGYWLKFPVPQSLQLSGSFITGDTLDLPGGWSIIGALSVPLAASAVVEDPPGVAATPFYGFDGGYVAADTLLPGRGYWIRLSSPGRLMLGTTPAEVR